MGEKSDMQKVIDGLAIFVRHGGTGVCAQHDKLYAGPDIEGALTPEELAQLEGLGWYKDGDDWVYYT